MPAAIWIKALELNDLLTVVLDARGAKTSQAVPVDGALPTEELVHRQRISLARFIKAQ
jgi:hypothetical protein